MIGSLLMEMAMCGSSPRASAWARWMAISCCGCGLYGVMRFGPCTHQPIDADILDVVVVPIVQLKMMQALSM